MYQKTSKGWIKHYDFVLLDLICLHVAFLIAYFVRHGNFNLYVNHIYKNMAVFMVLTDVVVMFFFDSFNNVIKRGYYREFVCTVKHAFLVCVGLVLYLFSLQEGQMYSRIVFFLTFILYFIFSYVIRILRKHALKERKDAGKRSLLIVTSGREVLDVIENIRNNNYGTYTISGLIIIDKDKVGCCIENIPVVSNKEDAIEYICREWIDEVLFVIKNDEEYPLDMIRKVVKAGITVHVNYDSIFDDLGSKQIVETIANYRVLTSSVNYITARQAFFKRVIDIIGGLVGCFITGVLFLFVAPAIYIKSPGPVIFAQERVGRNGKKFKIFKFRSMVLDAEEQKKDLMQDNIVEDDKMFKLEFDPRVIGNKILPDGTKKKGIGNFIRVTSIDEFPQFYNVLKGDMSLVGTRPPTVDEWELYELKHRVRLAIKPGITGMWQVSGRSSITDFEEVVKLDKEYITDWNIGVDIKIILKTIRKIFERDGSM